MMIIIHQFRLFNIPEKNNSNSFIWVDKFPSSSLNRKIYWFHRQICSENTRRRQRMSTQLCKKASEWIAQEKSREIIHKIHERKVTEHLSINSNISEMIRRISRLYDLASHQVCRMKRGNLDWSPWSFIFSIIRTPSEPENSDDYEKRNFSSWFMNFIENIGCCWRSSNVRRLR